MGEIADLMLDGTMCPCGEFINGGRDGPGFMQYCSPQCERDYGTPTHTFEDLEISGQRRFACDLCERSLKTPEGVRQHKQDKHGLAP